MKLQKYDFDLEYALGKTMVVSDTLSHAFINSNSSPELDESDIIHHVHSVIDSLPISTARLTQLQDETASDSVLQQLKQFTLWQAGPNKRSESYQQSNHTLLFGGRLLTTKIYSWKDSALLSLHLYAPPWKKSSTIVERICKSIVHFVKKAPNWQDV